MESTQWTPEQVRFFDIAHEGAQLRALAGQAAGLNAYLAGLRPRSVVVLATDQVAAAAAGCGGLVEEHYLTVVYLADRVDQ